MLNDVFGNMFDGKEYLPDPSEMPQSDVSVIYVNNLSGKVGDKSNMVLPAHVVAPAYEQLLEIIEIMGKPLKVMNISPIIANGDPFEAANLGYYVFMEYNGNRMFKVNNHFVGDVRSMEHARTTIDGIAKAVLSVQIGAMHNEESLKKGQAHVAMSYHEIDAFLRATEPYSASFMSPNRLAIEHTLDFLFNGSSGVRKLVDEYISAHKLGYGTAELQRKMAAAAAAGDFEKAIEIRNKLREPSEPEQPEIIPPPPIMGTIREIMESD